MKKLKALRLPVMLLAATMALTLITPAFLTASAAEAEVSSAGELGTALADSDSGEYIDIYLTDDILYGSDLTVSNGTYISVFVYDNDLTLQNITVTGDYSYFDSWWGGSGTLTAGDLLAQDDGTIWMDNCIVGSVLAESGGEVSLFNGAIVTGTVTSSGSYSYVQVSGEILGNIIADGGYIWVYGDVAGDVKAINGGKIDFDDYFPTVFTVGSTLYDLSVTDNPSETGRDNYYIWIIYSDGESMITFWIWDPLQSSGKKALPDAQPGGSWVQNANGTWSYINPDGKKAAGWLQTEDGAWYFIAPNGIMATGWVSINGVWYYFGEDGVMTANTSVTIDGVTYIFDENGKCTNP